MPTNIIKPSSFAVLVSFALMCSSSSYAQTESRTINRDKRQGNYPSMPDPSSSVDSSLGDPPGAGTVLRKPDLKRELAPVDGIQVKKIRVEGNTAFSDEELQIYTADYEGRVVSPEQLQRLRQDLTELYRNAGYLNSGVLLPDQAIRNGVITLRVLEGQLARTDIEGNKLVSDRYIEKRLLRGIDQPFNVDRLKANLLDLQNDAMVAQINAELRPGDRPGSDVLNVRVIDSDRWQTSFSFDNYRSPIVGEYRGSAYLAMRSPLHYGDLFNARVGLTEGATDLTLSYVAPINSSGSTLEAFYTDTDSDVVEGVFKNLDIESQNKSYGLLASIPTTRLNSKSVTLLYGLEVKESDTSSLGIPVGEAKGVSALFGAEGWIRNATNVLGARFTVLAGLDALDSTQRDGDLPDSDFSLIIGQAQYLRMLNMLQSQIIVRGNFQLASDPLLPVYKSAVGGRYTVRGYREAFFVRDNAANATLEWQVPFFINANTDWLNLRGALFTDYGLAYDEPGQFSIQGRGRIWSVGAGLLWNPKSWLRGEIYYGEQLKSRDDPRDGSLQDDGIQFQLVVTQSF